MAQSSCIPHYESGNYLDIVDQLCKNEKSKIKNKQPNENAQAIRSKMREIYAEHYPNNPDFTEFVLGTTIRLIRKVFDWGDIPRRDIFTFPLNLAKLMVEKYPASIYQRLLYLQKNVKDRNITLTNMCIIKVTSKCKIQRETRRYLRENIKHNIVHVEESPIVFCVFSGKNLFERIEYISYESYCMLEFDGRTFHNINTKNIDRALLCQN